MSDDNDDETVVEARREPKVGPSFQLDFEHDELGNVKEAEATFRSTVSRPRFKIPETPRSPIRISDRYRLLDFAVII